MRIIACASLFKAADQLASGNRIHINKFKYLWGAESNALATTSNLCYCSKDSGSPVPTMLRRRAVRKKMAKAIWNGKVIAESETTETVEGNVYFPENSLKREFFRSSSTTSTCPWKGQAKYMSLYIDGQDNPDAAWYYPDPKPAARKIKGFVAFWRGVEVEK